MNKLTLTLDASAFGESACMLRLFNTVIGASSKTPGGIELKGYAPKRTGNQMEFGSAVHQFRKVWRNTGNLPEAISAAQNYFQSHQPMIIEKKYLTEEFLIAVCMAYMTSYRGDNFEIIRSPETGTPLVEQKFCYPYYVDDLLEILFAGTMDELGTYNKVKFANGDLKVTSLWDKRKFFDGYRLSGQLRFYRSSLRQYARLYPNSIFRHIEDSENVVSFIDGVFHKPGAQDKMPTVEFERSPDIIFSNAELDEFDEVVKEKVQRFVEQVHAYVLHGKVPNRDGILTRSCSTVYGDCKFACACQHGDVIARQIVLDDNFTKQEYDPLTHGE